MINLIKNEVIKILHKKSIYILFIVATFLFVLMCSLEKAFMNDSMDEFFYSEEILNSYDLNEPVELEMFVADKTHIETYKLADQYDEKSFKYYYVTNFVIENISCMVNAEYVLKDQEAYNNCKLELDSSLNELNTMSSNDFVKMKKNEVLSDIEELKLLRNNTNSKQIDKEIEKLNYYLYGYNYHLDNNIEYGDGDVSKRVRNYVEEVVSFEQELDEYKTNGYEIARYQEIERMETEESIKVSRYMLDNKIEPSKDGAADFVLSQIIEVGVFPFAIVLIVAGVIVAEEFNKGTIKQLLLRPYSRFKILMSKLITCLIVFFSFIILLTLIQSLIAGITFGFDSFFDPIIVYNFNTLKVEEYSFISYVLINFMAILPQYLIILLFVFFIGVLSCNSSVSIVSGTFLYLGATIIEVFVMESTIKWLKFIPTMCWNFKEFLFGGLSYYKYASFSNSLIVTIITILVLFIGSVIVFNKKEISNQ